MCYEDSLKFKHRRKFAMWLESSSAAVLGYVAHGGNGTVVKNDRRNKKGEGFYYT